MATTMDILVEAWAKHKSNEELAQKFRREVEDEIVKLTALPIEGTAKFGELHITVKLNHKVDGEKLQVIANEAGLSDHLPSLFRWKPEINMKAWEATDESIKQKLALAITTKPARPSFKMIEKGDK